MQQSRGNFAQSEINYTSPKHKCAQDCFAAPLHATMPKGPFCRDNKVPLDDENEWPMDVVPAHAVHDRGPWMGPVADLLVDVLGVDLSNAPAYSPQLKASVEPTRASSAGRTPSLSDAGLQQQVGQSQ
jgi:hypothetical protein